MKGTRVYFKIPGPGEYGSLDGIWYCMPPGTNLLANITNHEIIEHDDKTITVSPSILVDNKRTSWHGYLERGVWREC